MSSNSQAERNVPSLLSSLPNILENNDIHGVSFSDLPGDIHVTIAEHCERGDLPNLCSITKWMHKSCAHVLYCNIDLSLHNRGVVTVHDQDDDEMKQMWSDNSACSFLCK